MTSVVIDSNELLGKTLGTCTLQSLLGRGGMGAVYLAQQSRPRRAVAVKVLMPGMPLDSESRSEFLARFRREADAIAALDHVNIMPIYEYGEEEGQLAYLVMPYVNGGTLRDVLERRGHLSVQEALPIIEQAASALTYAHTSGIIHRDLKPGNILFHSDGRVLLADFGLAKMIKGTSELKAETLTALTSAGTVIGTPEYLSPEQANAVPIDQRTDIYSLGIVLYQMLTGRLPFTGATPVAIAIKHMMEQPPSISAINPLISPAIEAVIMKAIAKNPNDRYSSAEDFAAALKTAVYEGGERTQAVTPPTTLTPPISTPPPSEPAPVKVVLRNEAKAEVPTTPRPSATTDPDHLPLSETPLSPAIIHPAVSPSIFRRSNNKIHTWLKVTVAIVAVFIITGVSLPFLIHNDSNSQSKGQTVAQTSATKQPATPKPTISVPTPTPTTAPPTAVPAKPTTPPQEKTLSPLTLSPKAPGVGSEIYATDSIGPCDKRGATWTSIGGTQANCSSDGTTLTGGSSISQSISGLFLDKLPNGQSLPASYTVEIQLDTASSAAVTLHSSDSSHKSGSAIQVTNANSFTAFDYRGDGPGTQITNVSSGQSISGPVTLSFVVQGGNINFYVNGQSIGYASDLNNSTGTFGIGSDAGSPLKIKTVAVYNS